MEHPGPSFVDLASLQENGEEESMESLFFNPEEGV